MQLSIVLNLVHTLEVSYQYQEAFNVLKTFLQNSATLSVDGLTASKVKHTCSSLYHHV